VVRIWFVHFALVLIARRAMLAYMSSGGADRVDVGPRPPPKPDHPVAPLRREFYATYASGTPVSKT
jgi:hypothetical protein